MASFFWGVVVTLLIDLLLAALGQNPIPFLVPVLVVVLTMAIGASHLQRRWTQRHPAGERMAASLVSALRRTEQLQNHEANLKQALVRVPMGEPSPNQRIWWDALQEHLPNDMMWQQVSRLRSLIEDSVEQEHVLWDHLFKAPWLLASVVGAQRTRRRALRCDHGEAELSRKQRASRGRTARGRKALGRDDTPELFDGVWAPMTTPRYVEPQPPTAPRRSEAVGVLTLGEAAARLGVSRPELEAMIAAGKIEALPTGWTRMIPTREIERLSRK